MAPTTYAEENEHYPGEPGDVAGQDVAVYGASDQPRPTCLRRRPEQDEPEDERQLARVRAQLSEEPPRGGTPVVGTLLRRACD